MVVVAGDCADRIDSGRSFDDIIIGLADGVLVGEHGVVEGWYNDGGGYWYGCLADQFAAVHIAAMSNDALV